MSAGAAPLAELLRRSAPPLEYLATDGFRRAARTGLPLRRASRTGSRERAGTRRSTPR